MKKTILLLFILSVQLGSAQTSKEQVESTLMNYINGSSYNKIEQLKSAFADDATLYLSGRVLSPQTYIGFFEEETPGKFNGRIGTILSIDVEEDIATAKVEILTPARNTRYIDLFLLKKKENKWVIISKTATATKSEKKGDRVIFFVSNAHFIGKSKARAGNSYAEIALAYDAFIKAGYNVDFVSPKGGSVPVSYIDTSDPIEKKYLYDEDFMYRLKHTKKPENVKTESYKAVYYIGGSAAMHGVPENKGIQKIAMDVYEKYNGVISSICHGAAGIVNLKKSNGEYLVKGKRVNGYPYDSEDMEELPFLIKKVITNRGGIFKFSPRNTPHVEVDGRLITGQNSLSSKLVVQKVIETLKKQKES